MTQVAPLPSSRAPAPQSSPSLLPRNAACRSFVAASHPQLLFVPFMEAAPPRPRRGAAGTLPRARRSGLPGQGGAMVGGGYGQGGARLNQPGMVRKLT